MNVSMNVLKAPSTLPFWLLIIDMDKKTLEICSKTDEGGTHGDQSQDLIKQGRSINTYQVWSREGVDECMTENGFINPDNNIIPD